MDVVAKNASVKGRVEGIWEKIHAKIWVVKTRQGELFTSMQNIVFNDFFDFAVGLEIDQPN